MQKPAILLLGFTLAGTSLPLLAQTSDEDCDPNYTGDCVPVVTDVDCAGGKGNGPAHLLGRAYVVGEDIYGLDRDTDGVGCE